MLKRCINGFSKNGAQYVVLARTPGSHPQHFQPHFHFEFHDVNCPLSWSDAEISYANWPIKKLRRQDRRKPIPKTEKSNLLICCVFIFFTPDEGYNLDPYLGTMPIAIVAMDSIDPARPLKRMTHASITLWIGWRQWQARWRSQGPPVWRNVLWAFMK